jgi:peptidyl-prolyl cis-trans isomerase A (cyclophilin A)
MYWRLGTGVAVIAASLMQAAPGASQNLPVVTMETDRGAIVIEIDTARAPITGANFLRYVDAGLYDGGSFYRTVTMQNQPDDDIRIEVIQGGIAPSREEERFPAIPLETTRHTGLRHLDGTISVARAGPNTGSSEIFICVGDQPELDFGGKRNPDGQGFAAFGRVMRGMDVVRRIHQQPVSGQRLVNAVGIENVRRVP